MLISLIDEGAVPLYIYIQILFVFNYPDDCYIHDET